MRVVVNGYEDGFDDVSPEWIAVVKVQIEPRYERLAGSARGPATADPRNAC